MVFEGRMASNGCCSVNMTSDKIAWKGGWKNVWDGAKVYVWDGDESSRHQTLIMLQDKHLWVDMGWVGNYGAGWARSLGSAVIKVKRKYW